MALQSVHAHVLGLLVANNSAPTSSTFNVNAAAARHMYAFVCEEAMTPSKFRFFVSAVTGTLGATDIVVDLFDFGAGAITTTTAPSSSLQSRTSVTATPTGAAWVEVTGFSTALTAGKLYAFIIRNANASPAANFFTIRYSSTADFALVGGSGGVAWRRAASADSGATYTTPVAGISGFRIETSSPASSYIGVPFSLGGVTVVGDGIYSGRELGVKFTTPADAKLALMGLGTRPTVTGTPTGNLRFRLYQGTSIVASTNPCGNWTSTAAQNGYFTTREVLEPSTEYRIVLAKDAGDADASTNRFNLHEFTVENDANSKALLPFGGWVKTYWDGATWTDTDTSAVPFWLILDTTDPFDASASAGPKGRRTIPLGVMRGA